MGFENGGFEGEYYMDGAPEVFVAPFWKAFYSENGTTPEGHGPTVRPEFKKLPASVDPRRVREGEAAQCWFTVWNNHDAGVMQAFTVPEGNKVTFRAWLHCWCSDSNDPTADDGEMYGSVGLDPQGGWNPWDVRVKWKPWTRLTAEWQKLAVTTVPTGPVTTAFVRTWNKYKLAHNDAYLDEASIVLTPIEPPPTGDCRYDPKDIANAVGLIESRLDMLQTAVMAHVDQKLAAHLAAVRQLIDKRNPVIWPKE